MKIKARSTILSLVLVLFWLPSAGGAVDRTTELVMFEQANCAWCAAWTRQVGPIYPKTVEGHRAPLRRVDIHASRPDDLKGVAATPFTPTFVLMHEGREIGRISGYPGEDFFWGLLDQLMQKLPSR